MKIYFDNAATTQMSSTAIHAMEAAYTGLYGNPSSLHSWGQSAAAALQDARERIARAIGADPQEIYFTSGGTEADNQAIFSAAQLGAKKNKRHIISSVIEHHAVLHPLEALQKQGYEVTLLPVDGDGRVSVASLEQAFREDTALVTVMFANNEIGSIQPIAELAAACQARKVPFHTDAVQAVGHLLLNVKSLGVDLLSFSAHKFHGPKGVGALYCRKGLPLRAYLLGGAQERGRRAGTENLPGVLGMAAALKEATAELPEVSARLCGFRDQCIAELSKIPDSLLNGGRQERLPGNVSFCFAGIEGESLLLLLDARGIGASSGSACTSGSLEPSHVLLALGRPHEIAHGSLRLSFSRYTTQDELDHLLEVLPGVVNYLRSISPVWDAMQKIK